MPDEPATDESKRRFLGEGLVHLAGGAGWLIEQSVAPVTRAIKGIASMRQPAPAEPESEQPLRDPRLAKTLGVRPPGALADKQAFAAACTGCGDCARICHRTAIAMVPGEAGKDVPTVDPNVAACDMCGLCMETCPTDALQKTLRESIALGRAKWFPDHCLRVSRDGEEPVGAECDACFRACPFPWRALRFTGAAVAIGPACTGCGLCVEACPSLPRALLVLPSPPAKG